MFLNYFITAWRNLLKFRAVSAINIFGLTLGLASAVLAIMYARHELTYENSHEKADRICRIYTKGNFGEVQQIPTTLGPEGEALNNMFPEIEAYTISRSMSTTVRAGENLFIEDDIIFSDSMTFDIFTIPFMEGNSSQDPQTVILSEKAAVRYFGKGSPVGKSITINCYGTKWDFLVTGVFKDFPSNTHLQGEFIIPFSFSKRFGFWKPEEYQSTTYNSYVLLRPGTDIKALNKKIAESYKIPVDIENISSFLMPLKEIHFKGTWQNNKGKLIVLLIGGLFVLITSCLNYINLTNILFSTRAKEAGIRKINGGNRKHIFSQFLVDTLLSTLISFNLAIILLKIILPLFNAQMDTHISLKVDGQAILLMITIFMVTVLLSGIYPALKYSAQRPVMLLRLETVSENGRAYSRWILTTFQFILAVVCGRFKSRPVRSLPQRVREVGLVLWERASRPRLGRQVRISTCKVAPTEGVKLGCFSRIGR
ncbi:MAG: ABC transporter permease, partial [Bacteroidales bacterium]